MKQQIKKLCKQLSRFNFDEIASILELSEDEIQKVLKELIEEKVLSKISETEFAYVPDIVHIHKLKHGNKISKLNILSPHYVLI